MSVICEFELQSADMPLCAVQRTGTPEQSVDEVVIGSTTPLSCSPRRASNGRTASASLGDESVVESSASNRRSSSHGIGSSSIRTPSKEPQLVDRQSFRWVRS
ncbi:hypothetical protein C9J85_09665 [Haloferax sp. wsp5]|nr:hypothetical protein C9J85_09665 [Haloferax sp. wsp5]